jgi:exosortase E/protease (VPEID-CTERM system)
MTAIPIRSTAVAPTLRWTLPAALLIGEYLAISFLVDLPMSGPAMRLVGAVRLLVPVVIGGGAAGWLLARGRQDPAAGELDPLPAWRPWPALALQPFAFYTTAAFAVYLLGDGAPQPSTAMLSALLACAAATGLLAIESAVPLRWLARAAVVRWRLPLLALGLGVLAWRAASAAEGLWGLLSSSTLAGVAALLRLGDGVVTVDPVQRLIGLDAFTVRVAPVCSGADGVGLVVLFQGIWISLARDRLRVRRALLLLPLGAVAALAANVVRIAVLVRVGAGGQEALAFGGLHSKLGWILFTGIALASVAVAERVDWFAQPEPGADRAPGGVPAEAAAQVAPLLAALAAGVLTSLFTDGPFDPWYWARIAAAAGALALVRRALPSPAISGSWATVGIAAAVAAIWIGLARGGDGAALVAELERLAPTSRIAWVAVRLLGACVVVPVVEELAFRGFLLPWLVSPDPARVPQRAAIGAAVLASSLAFGALHAHWVLGTAAGVAFAVARLRRGRLSDAVVAHALANAAIAVAVLGFGRWDLWS